jgi:LAO/AO transport system kinase
MAAPPWDELVSGVVERRPRAVARLITMVESREPGWQEAMRALYPRTGDARVVGITGPPGAGKSTLTNQVSRTLVAQGRRVGIIAVDPSSPFSGGALLGDRIRMRDILTAPGVFIRSMATRGSLGGLSQAARDVARILDAAGYDDVLIETVGVGQDEVDVVRAADLVIVVCVPGQGDAVQILKAGIMEIADIFVVNKADHPGAHELTMEIASMLELARLDACDDTPASCHVPALDADLNGDEAVWRVDVVETCAVSGEGIPRLVDAITEQFAEPAAAKASAHARAREEILALVDAELAGVARRRLAASLPEAAAHVAKMETDPYSAAEQLLAELGIQ